MKSADILELLEVVDGTRNLPKLKIIHDKAMAELEAIAEEMAKPEKDDWEKAALVKPLSSKRAEV